MPNPTHPEDPMKTCVDKGPLSQIGSVTPYICDYKRIIYQNPDPANLADIFLASEPRFVLNSQGQFFIVFSCRGGYISSCSVTDIGTGEITMEPQDSYSEQICIECSFGASGNPTPADDQEFWFKVVNPKRPAGKRAREIKWAYKRQNK